MRVGRLQVGQQVEVDQDGPEVQTGGGGDEEEEVEHTEDAHVFLHGGTVLAGPGVRCDCLCRRCLTEVYRQMYRQLTHGPPVVQ